VVSQMASFLDQNPLQKLGLLMSGIASTTSRDPRYLQTNLAMQDSFQEMKDRERMEAEREKQDLLLRRLANPTSQDMIGTPATKAFEVNGRMVGQNAPAQMQQVMPDEMRLRSLQRAMPKQFMAAQLEQLLAGPQQVKMAPGEKLGYMRGGQFVEVADNPKSDEMTPWQKAQLENQDRQFSLAEQRLGQQEARAAEQERLRTEAENRRNRPQATGYVSASTGNPLRYDPNLQAYKDGDNVVDSAELVASADFNKELTKAREISGNVARAMKIKKTAEDNPSAFAKDKVNQARMKGNVPFFGDQLAAATFTDDENKIRAEVARESAAIVNELYGAALSAGEQGRAQQFTPGAEDTLEMLLPKLDAGIEWARQQEKAILPGALSKARKQLGVSDAPAATNERPKTAPPEARQAKDKKWYTPDPLRPGKYVLWE
jgi:hypothetical protein